MHRRNFLAALTSSVAIFTTPLFAQNRPEQKRPQQKPAEVVQPKPPPFTYESVLERAKALAEQPFQPIPSLPAAFPKLDFDQWRDIRFKPDRALLAEKGSLFRLQAFHPGFLYTQPITINLFRDGHAVPLAYQSGMFEFGRNKFEKPLPVSTGLAGFRLHYPLNDPQVFDELISFVGASYFRFLGQGQKYGLSARGASLGVGSAETEEFPVFREFWIVTPEPESERIVIFALLDGPSMSGAFRFDLYAGKQSVVEVTATLFARKRLERLGIATLTSMFFTGENDRRFVDDFRPELHDSDGLMIHTSTGEWIWRPLRNPARMEASAFLDEQPRGFGLMQRDRTFEHYQDLDLSYEQRPSYWIEPLQGFGDGKIELFEIPTDNETNDNIVAQWAPLKPMEAGESRTWRYRITSTMREGEITPGGIARNTYRTKPRALGSGEVLSSNQTRFIIDFTDGQLPYYFRAPERVQVVPSISTGRILRTFVTPNDKTRGFRAAIDVEVPPGQSADIRAFLKAGDKALTETWTYPWRPE